MMRSNESASSVFYHSQEEDLVKMTFDSQGPHREPHSHSLYDSYLDSMSESNPATVEQDLVGKKLLCVISEGIRDLIQV